MRIYIISAFVLCFSFLLTLHGEQASASEIPVYTLTLHNHAFSPRKLAVPANKKVRLIVKNMDATPAEFESYPLNREKLVPRKDSVTIYIGPLDPGSYPFFDDFHHKTTTGTITAK